MTHFIFALALARSAPAATLTLKNRACAALLTSFREHPNQLVDSRQALKMFRLQTFTREQIETTRASARPVRGRMSGPDLRVLARLSGLLADESRVDHPVQAGLVIDGAEQIAVWIAEIDSLAKEWAREFNGATEMGNTAYQVSAGVFITSLCLYTWSVLQDPIFQSGGTQLFSAVASTIVALGGSVSGPEWILRLGTRLDPSFYTFTRLPDLAEIDTDHWRYDALNYRLPESVVRELWFGSPTLRATVRDDLYRAFPLPMRWLIRSHAPPDPSPPTFVMIDRLIRWNSRINKHQMILFLRASPRRPTYPRLSPQDEPGWENQGVLSGGT